MVACKIRGCKNRSDKTSKLKIHYYSFPRNQKLILKWLKYCKTPLLTKNSRVCSDHFRPSDYKPKADYLRECGNRIAVRALLPDAVPTRNLGVPNNNSYSDDECEDTNVPNIQHQNNILLSQTNSSKNDSPKIVYLEVFSDQSEINDTSIFDTSTSADQESSHGNLDVLLEDIEAPAYVLDHQYATYNNQKTNNEKIYLRHQAAIIAKLRKQLQYERSVKLNLQKQVKRLQEGSKIYIDKKVEDILGTIFTQKQIDRLLNPTKTKIKWTVEDIISGITLQNISPKAYSYLKEKNYPLPFTSTLRKWANCLSVSEGILSDVIKLMRYKSKSLSIFQKIIVLNFCETVILNQNCLICTARGLFYNWMQLIYYKFDQSLSSNILIDIISELYNIGYIVVVITSNLEFLRDELWINLNVGIEHNQQCYFKHPNNSDCKIFVFPHNLHLLILIRMYFLYNGFLLRDKIINKICLEDVVNINKTFEESEYYNLEELIDSEYGRDNASLSKQLFSRSVAQTIFHYGSEGIVLNNTDWKECANFFESLSDWINLFDSKVKEGYEAYQMPYGLDLEHQNEVLIGIINIMKETKIQNLEILTPIQDQIILSCLALPELLHYIQERFSIEDFQINYILTYRLSSELSENLVAYIRGDYVEDNMSLSKFQSRLRKSVIGKYSTDSVFDEILKVVEPSLIDFNERSDFSSDLCDNEALLDQELNVNI